MARNEAMTVKAQLDNCSVRRTRRKGIEGVDETRSWDPDEKERDEETIPTRMKQLAQGHTEEKKEEIEKKKKEKERKEGRKGERREGRNLLHLREPVINRATNTD